MRYDGILLCSDFDGTLSSGGKISKENLDAIRMFQEKGGLFTLATGRAPDYIAETASELTVNAPMISVNGACLFDCAKNKELYKIPLNDTSDFSKNILCHKNCLRVRIVRQDYSIVSVENGDVANLEKYLNEPLFKLVYVFDQTDAPVENLNRYKEKFGDRFYFSRSWEYSLEVLSINATKGEMLKRLKRTLPNVNLTVGVGDFDNDVPLVKEADIGYAVANGVQSVKDAADRITVSCKDHAIAKIIYEL
ncbi:MAG: HAD-IIB family hydrolase [Clostridia bacterium]|nr:HAD-IIB family hydrolase [Clostridia bacterium]